MRSESSDVSKRWGLNRIRRHLARKSQKTRLALESLEVRSLLATLPLPVVVGQIDISNTRDSDESAPSIAVDPVNPNNVVAVWVRNSATDNPGVRPHDSIPLFVQAAYSVDGGNTWNNLTVSQALRDPNIAPPAFPNYYTRITEPTVSFDRAGSFYILSQYSNGDNSSGALALSKYSLTSGTPVATYRNRFLYQWTPGFDRALLPSLTVDNTVGAQLVGLNRLNRPTRPIFGPSGDFFVINDTTNDILRYNATGDFVSVFVAPGSGGLVDPQSIAFGPDGNLYVADGNAVRRYNGTTGAPLGTFVAPGSGGLITARDIAFGPDFNLYVTDSTANAVRRYSIFTGAFIDNFVPSGSGGLVTPDSLTFGPDGNLYVASLTNNSVLRYNGTTGAFINTFVTPGAGGLVQPSDLDFAPDGTLHVASLGTDQILQYDGATGAFISVYVTPGAGGLDDPSGLVFGPDGNLYVTSRLTNAVLRFVASGSFLGDFVTAGSGGLDSPSAMVVGPTGNLLVVSDNTNSILQYGPTGNFIATFVAAGSGGLGNIRSMTLGSDGNLYVADTTAVRRYNGTTGAFIDIFVAAGSGGLALASDITFGPDGNLYLTDSSTSSVLRYNGTTGAFINTFVTAGDGGLVFPSTLAFGPDGNLYVASLTVSNVLRYSGFSGNFLNTFVAPASGGLSQPTDLRFTPSGSLLVASRATDSVLSYDGTSGAFLAPYVAAGSGGLNGPAGLTFDAAGNLYVSSSLTDSVLQFSRSVGAFDEVFTQDEPILQGGFADPDTSDRQDNVYSNNVYVAYTTQDVAPAYGPNNYNPNRVVLIGSSDGGNSFTPSITLNDGGNFGSQRNARPRIAVSQGTTDGLIPGGRVSVVWDDFGSASTASPPFDIIKADRLDAGISHEATVTNRPIPDGGFVQIPINVNISDLRFTTLADLDVELAITHPNTEELLIELVAPDGTTVTLVQNQIVGGTANQFRGINGANVGVLNGVQVGTIFNDEAVRNIVDFTNQPPARGAAAPYIGNFQPEDDNGIDSGLSQFYEDLFRPAMPRREINGTWILRVTDVRAQNAGSVNFVTLRFRSGLEPGSDVQVATTYVRGAAGTDYSRATNAHPNGIGPGAVIASDNTLGSFSPFQGRIYVAYTERLNVSNNPTENTDIFLKYSDDGGQTWTAANLVHDDDARLDGYTEGDHLRVTGRPQFQPQLVVDPITGTVALSWLDTRDDAARARVATYMTTSIDGGETFGANNFVNQAQTAIDAITGDTIVIGPIPDNQSSGNGTRDATNAFGDQHGLAILNGRLYAAWSSNINAGVGPGGTDGTTRLDVRVAPVIIGTGPRVIDSTMGPIGLTDQFGNPIDTLNPGRTPDGTPILGQTLSAPQAGFEVVFDRPIDPSTFRPEDVAVFYRDTTNNNASGATVPIIDVVPVPSQFGDPDYQYNFGNIYGYTRFRVIVAPRSGVGTYSYTIGPELNDRIRSFKSQLVPVQTNTYNAAVNPSQVNLRIPPVLTGGSGSGNFDTTTSTLNVFGLPNGELVTDVNVTVNVVHADISQLTLDLISPDGTVIRLSNRNGFGTNFTNTTFDDQATTSIAAGVPPYTGSFRPSAPLSGFVGRLPNGNWRLRIVDNVQGGIGTLVGWTLQLQTGTVQPTLVSGNLMDQDADTRGGEPAIDQVGIGDVYAAPRPTGSGPAFRVDPTKFFPGPYDPDTLPLIISGPRIISSQVPGTAVSSDNLALDRPVNSLDVTFDRDMAIGTFTGADLLGLRGPIDEIIRSQSFTATDTGQTIPDAPPAPGVPTTISSTLTIPDDGTFHIGDLNVRLTLTHPRVSDLNIELYGPDGTKVTLANGIGGNGANFTNTIFDDESPQSIGVGTAPFTGVFRPLESLTAFDGKELRGTWTLKVTDLANGGAGIGTPTLVAWGMDITPQATVTPAFNAPISLTNPAFIIPDVGTITSNLVVPNDGGAFKIADLNIGLDITHLRPTDLKIDLVYHPGQPDEIVVPLVLDRVGSNLLRNYTGTIFDDQASIPINQAPSSSFTGVYLPQNGSLAVLNGKEIQGNWALRVTDTTPGSNDPTGRIQARLNGWSLLATPNSPTATARTFRVTFPTQTSSGTYSLTIGSDIRSQNGDPVDTNLNAGVDLLRGTAQSAPTVPVTFPSTNVPLSLPDTSTTVSVLTVDDGFIISDLNLTLDITHIYVPDLRAVLVAPDGTRVVLFDGVGAVGPINTRRNFTNTTFDDQATTPIQFGGPPFFGTFNPQEPLGVFNGKNAAGTWVLEVTDTTAGNDDSTNRLNSWAITFRKPVPNSGLGEPVADRSAQSFRIFTMDPANPLSSAAWTPVGPAGITANTTRNGYSGRISAIAVDPSDPSGNTVYVGAASGGVWKTSDFLTNDPDGPTWVPLTDFGPTISLNIGSIAVFGRNNDPNQSIILVSTGEASAQFGYGSTGGANNQGSTALGVGFLRSTDGGATWTLLDSTNNNLPFAQRDHAFNNSRGFKVVVDPTITLNGEVIAYAAISGNNAGFYRSLDTGQTWQRMREGNATDVTLDYFSKSNERLDSNGLPAGNIDNLYVAFDGDGVYFSPNRGQTLNLMTGQIGVQQLRDGDVAGVPAIPVNNLPSPNGQAGRIVLAKPEPVPFSDPNSAVKNILYQGWLYAVVSTNGGVQGLYLTKDNGQTWTQLQVNTRPRPNENDQISRPTNDFNAPDYDVARSNGQYNISLTVDPLNPNIVYVGGSSTFQESGLIRVDATRINDAHALLTFDHDRPDGGTTAVGGNGAAAAVIKDLPNRGIGGHFLPPFYFSVDRTQYLNLIQDPGTPFVVGSNVYLANVASFNNDGTGVRWIPFDNLLLASEFDFLPSSNVHQVVSYRDPLTGNARLIVANDNGVFTGVSLENGQLDPGIGTAVAPTLSRVGNLQVGQLYQGGVQPSTIAAQIAGAIFYGMTQGNGFPESDPLMIGNAPTDPSNGQIDWVGSNNGEFVGYNVETDAQGKGTVYKYLSPGLGGSLVEFFQVNGIARTRGLLQASPDPQWPNLGPIYNGLISMGRFTVNPLNGDQIAISSNVGRIFGTTNQGRQWNVIGNPGDLDGTYAPALTYGAPDPGAPGGIGNLGNFIYAGTIGGNIFVTRTGGGSGGGSAWQNISNGLDGSSVVSIITSPDRGSHAAYAATLNGVYYTPDSLTTPWSNITANLFNIQHAGFANPDFSDQKLGFLTDVVADWRYAIPQDVATGIGPTHPILYVSGNAGVFRSLDNGLSWTLFPTEADGARADGGNLPSVHVADLDVSMGPIDPTNGRPIIDSSSPNIITASTFGRGMFAMRLGPQVFADSLRFATGSDSGSSATDRITNVTSPVIEGLSAQSAFGSTITVELIDLTDPANPMVVGTGTTDEFGKFRIQITSPLTDGVKTIGVQAIDQAGTRGNMAPFQFTLDTTPPSAPNSPDLTDASDSPDAANPRFVAGITDKDNYTNVTAPTFDVGSTEPTTTVLTLLRNGQPVNTRNGGGLVTDPGDPDPNNPGSFLPLTDGIYAYTAQQLDLAGNASVSSSALSVTIDTAAPVQPAAPVLNPLDDTGVPGDNITGVPQPRLSGTAEPGSLILLINQAGNELGRTTTNSNGTYEVQPTSPLAEGPNTLRIRAIDLAGNTSQDSPNLSLVISTQPPTAATLALVSVDDSGIVGDNITSNTRPRFTGIATPGLTVELLDIDNGNAILGTAIVANDGTYLIRPVNVMAERTYRLQTRARNASGNTSLSNILQVTIDLTPPTQAPTLQLRPEDDTGVVGDNITSKRRPRFIGVTEPRATVDLVNSTGQILATTVAGPTGSFTLDLASNLTNGTITLRARVRDLAGNQGPPSAPLTIKIVTTAYDYDNDGVSDPAVFQPSSGIWTLLQSTSGRRFVSLGQGGDVPVTGDFNGDGQTDTAVYRPSEGSWYVSVPGSTTAFRVNWGLSGDIPVPADYDGDGFTDYGVYRPSEGKWYILPRAGTPTLGAAWGLNGDIPVPADYNGDSKTDLAVYRPSEGKWYILFRGTGAPSPIFGQPWGLPGDIPVPGDYDGNTQSDYAVYRPSEGKWYVQYRGTGTPAHVLGAQWGLSTDIPVPADYDGDGKFDYSVYRPSSGQYLTIRSSNGTVLIQVPGQTNEVPVQGPYANRRTTANPVARVASVQTAAAGSLNLGQTAATFAAAPAPTTAKTATAATIPVTTQTTPAAPLSLTAAQRNLARFRRTGLNRG